MNTDRELLELAAKAAGVNANARWSEVTRTWLGDEETTNEFWNPLTDDGDALRLAVKLGIPIDFCHSSGYVTATNPWNGLGQAEICDDMNVAARRAIVRAAAEVGKSLG